VAPKPAPALAQFTLADRVLAHIAIARLDHSAKNIFILPGIVLALAVEPGAFVRPGFVWRLAAAIAALTLVACSNYVINEILDAPYDRFHPVKRHREVPSGRVNIPAGYVQWIAMMAVGLGLAWTINRPYAITLGVLWIMGCLYNIPPARTKDVPYLDVLSESVNNPLRLLAGWYMVVDQVIPPASLLVAYWMGGAYLMALKRFSEYRQIGDPARAAAYRKPFRYYTDVRLLVSIMFYASTAMMFFGAFSIRYKAELVLAFPFIAYVMAVYLLLAFDHNSAVQNPEKLHREPRLMLPVLVCALVLAVLLWVELPWLNEFIRPTIPAV
jgi:4-hydroxybenzoate polyprenyltransferase